MGSYEKPENQEDTGPSLGESKNAQVAAELAHLDHLRQGQANDPEAGEATQYLEAAADEAVEASDTELEEQHERVPVWLKEVGKDVGILLAVGAATIAARRYEIAPAITDNPYFPSGASTTITGVRRALRQAMIWRREDEAAARIEASAGGAEQDDELEQSG